MCAIIEDYLLLYDKVNGDRYQDLSSENIAQLLITSAETLLELGSTVLEGKRLQNVVSRLLQTAQNLRELRSICHDKLRIDL
jgi:hypothetical protein